MFYIVNSRTVDSINLRWNFSSIFAQVLQRMGAQERIKAKVLNCHSCKAEQTLQRLFRLLYIIPWALTWRRRAQPTGLCECQGSFVKTTTSHRPNQIRPVKLKLLDSRPVFSLSVCRPHLPPFPQQVFISPKGYHYNTVNTLKFLCSAMWHNVEHTDPYQWWEAWL